MRIGRRTQTTPLRLRLNKLFSRVPIYYRSHLAMLLFSALVAGSFALGVRIANDITPAALTILRFILATAALVGIAVFLGRFKPNELRSGWRFLILGACLAIYFILMFEGLKIASSVSTSAVFTLTPALSGFFGFFLLKQKMTGWVGSALIIGAIGALWVIFQGDLQRVLSFDVGHGEMIFFVGVVFHALYTPLVRRLNKGESPLMFTLGTTAGALLILVFYGANDIRQTDLSALSIQIWITIIYLAIFASATTFFLIQFATLHLPSANVMAYTYLVPSWVIVWELCLGGTIPNIEIIGGMMLTVIALLMLLRVR